MSAVYKQAAKLGIFVFTVAAILVVALFLIGGLAFLRPVDTYHVLTSEGASGIDVGSRVTLRGVEIGKVAAIEIDRSDFARVQIDLDVDPDIELPVGSEAYFERVGLTGERVVNITGGTLADGRIAPGSNLPYVQTDLDRLESQAGEAADRLLDLIDEVTTTVEDIQVLVGAIDPDRVAAIVANTQNATKTIASTSKQLRRTVRDGREHVGAIRQDVDEVATKTSTVLDHADELVKQNEHDIRVLLENLRAASQDAKALMEALREQPSLLLKSKRKKPKKRHKPR